MKKLIINAACLNFFLLVACFAQETNNKVVLKESDFPAPPKAVIKPEVSSLHGSMRTDNYHWLKDRNNPATISYLEEENAYTELVTKNNKPLAEKLYNEMRQRIVEEDQSAPYHYNGYYYYNKTEKDKQYVIYCRKRGSLAGEEEILFDGNIMAEGKKAFLLATYEISQDNRYAAYLSNETGSYAEFTLRVRDLKTSSDIEGFEIPGVSSIAWANDNRTIFYTGINKSMRPWRVYRHDVFGARSAELIYQEDDELFNVNLQKAKTNELIFISSFSFSSSEYRMVNANNPLEAPKVFKPRGATIQYSIEHHDQYFFIRYKDSSNINGMIYQVPVNSYLNTDKWKVILAHDPDTRIDKIDVYHDFWAVKMRNQGLIKIKVTGISASYDKSISFPEAVYTADIVPLPDFNSSKVRYSYASLNRPPTILDYDPAEGKSEIVKETIIPSGFNPGDYVVERLWADASDGKKVPMAIVYRKGLTKNSKNPALVYGYGAYGYSTDANFISSFYSLVDRGFILALAQVRGGSELGEQWYEDGKMLNKKKSFTDLIACCEQLIKNQYTSSDKLSIMGGSAGGLLVAAAANMRPDLFHTVVAQVPFVDVINTMSDPTLPLTTQEYEEWGNPGKREHFDYILAYSPYDNIGPYNYPNILVTAGLNDSQVLFHEPAKYVAKLRQYKTGDNLLLLKTNMESGHGGATGRYEYLKERAFQLAFILERSGITK